MKYVKHIIYIMSVLIGLFLFYCLVFCNLSDGVEFWIGLCAFIFIFIPLNDYR